MLLRTISLSSCEVIRRSEVITPIAWRNLFDVQTAERTALLGARTAERFERYTESAPVRAEIAQFRARLRESDTLTDQQHEALIASLQNECERFQSDVDREYEGLTVRMTLGTWYGGSFKASDEMGASTEAQLLRQARSYSDRMTKAASEVLTPRQLAIFSEIQQERLASEKVNVRLRYTN